MALRGAASAALAALLAPKPILYEKLTRLAETRLAQHISNDLHIV